MSQAFYTGLSGLRSGQQSIDVISDNLANVSTVGYRSSTTEFSNLFESMINTGPQNSSVDSSIGIGSRVSSISMDESRGVIQTGDRSTDLAILGDGWFGIKGANNPLYTRDGSFNFDGNGDLVTADGLYVLGTMGKNISGNNIPPYNDADGNLVTPSIVPEYDAEGKLANPSIALGDIGNQEKLRFPVSLTFPALPTTKATFEGNLSFTAEEITQDAKALADIAANILDPTNEIEIDRVALSMSSLVVAEDGSKNKLRLEFTKANPQVLPGSQWDVVATVANVNDKTVHATETGTIVFDSNGGLSSNTLTTIDNLGTSVEINLGEEYTGLISSPGSIFSSSSSSNGQESGDLIGYDINKNGEVIATFTNGMQNSIAKVAVYHFANDKGLERSGGSRFTQSHNSGEAIFFKDADNNNILGTDLINFKLEGSNVRLDVGLTELIIMQRSYDANSKTVSTADQMLQKALNMDA